MEKTIARFQASTDEDLRWQLQFNGLDLSGRTLAVHVRERGSNALKVKLTIGSGLTLIGTGNLNASIARSTMLGWARTEYETDVVDETGGDATTILAVRVVYDHPGNLPYGVRGNQATVQWGANQAVVTAIGGVGPRGPAGPPNVITIGDVFTLETGELAAAELTGEAPAQALNLWLPKGNTGGQGLQGIQGIQGLQGFRGWTPLLAVVPDGVREVLQVVDWTGGEGTRPATGLYVGDAGLVPDIANAGNIRGAQGPSGSVTDGDKGDIVVSAAGTAWTIDSAYTAQWMPKTGGVFTGDTGISKSWPHFTLNKQASGEANVIVGYTDGDLRWQVRIGSDHPETGADAGSDLDIVRFSDAGAYLGIAFTLKRDTGQMQLSTRPMFNGYTPFDTGNLGAFAGDSGSGGVWGLVPAPAAGDATKFLSGAGTWVAGLNPGAGLTAAVATNALTISLTTAGGLAPSPGSPAVIPFSQADGTTVERKVTSALTLTITNGSTLGFANATAGRVWVVAFDDAGTARLGAINCRSGVNIFPLGQFGIASSTAEGGAGAADNAHVFYTGTAVTSKAYTVLGYLEWPAGLTTAGAWSAFPTRIAAFHPGMKLPGDVIQYREAINNTYTTNGANAVPADDTEPQNTEGDAISTLVFAPSSSANVLDVSTSGQIGSLVANTGVVLTLCRSDQSNAFAASSAFIDAAGGYLPVELKRRVLAGTTSSINLTNRYGPFSSGSGRSINGGAGSRQFGASQVFVLEAKEIVA